MVRLDQAFDDGWVSLPLSYLNRNTNIHRPSAQSPKQTSAGSFPARACPHGLSRSAATTPPASTTSTCATPAAPVSPFLLLTRSTASPSGSIDRPPRGQARRRPASSRQHRRLDLALAGLAHRENSKTTKQNKTFPLFYLIAPSGLFLYRSYLSFLYFLLLSFSFCRVLDIPFSFIPNFIQSCIQVVQVAYFILTNYASFLSYLN